MQYMPPVSPVFVVVFRNPTSGQLVIPAKAAYISRFVV